MKDLDPNPDPDPLVRGMDPRVRIRIRTKCHGSATLLLQAAMNASRGSPPAPGRAAPPRGVGFRPPAFGTTRGARVKLTVSIRAPLLVLPMSSGSSRVLMIDLGSLEIRNRFSLAGDEGTISATKLSHLRSGELGGRRSRAQSGSRSSHRSRSSRRSNKSTGKN